jgi:hypothetical protein
MRRSPYTLLLALIGLIVALPIYVLLHSILPAEFYAVSDSQGGLFFAAMFFALALLLLILPEEIIIKWDRAQLEWQRNRSRGDRSTLSTWQRAYGDKAALKKWLRQYRWGGFACLLIAFLTLLLLSVDG